MRLASLGSLFVFFFFFFFQAEDGIRDIGVTGVQTCALPISAISLAGPCAGALAAGLCALLWFQTGYGLWAALARTGAWFNALNLIPLWIFDGNSAANALSKLERAVVLLVSAALGYALGEWVFGLDAAGMVIRLFTR